MGPKESKNLFKNLSRTSSVSNTQPLFSYNTTNNFALAKKIVNHLGGKIWVGNSNINGLSIFFRVPVLSYSKKRGAQSINFSSLTQHNFGNSVRNIVQDIDSQNKRLASS